MNATKTTINSSTFATSSGGRGHGGYKIFQVLAVLSKRPVRIETGTKVVGSMEVYLKEPSSKEKEEFEMLKTIRTREGVEL